MRVLLDTSFIVAFLFDRDVFHHEAVSKVKHLSDTAKFYTIPLVVQETATVICRRCRERGIDHRKALEVYEEFLESLNIVDVPYSHKEILEEVKRGDCELSFVDMVLLKSSERLKARILTFDKRLGGT